MISHKLKRQSPRSEVEDAQVPQRYRRALKALNAASAPYATAGYPAAYLAGLRSIASKVRGATWCEYRRAAVLACRAVGLNEAADSIQKLKQAECSATRPGRRYRRRTISRDEVMKLIEKAKEQGDMTLAFALQLGWTYGIRAAELMHLQLTGNRLYVRSAKRTHNRGNDRKFAISDRNSKIVQTYIPLLARETSAAIRMRLYRLCKLVMPNRLGITIHRIRHQVASDLKRSKVPLLVIAKVLGHRSMKSVKVYGDPRRGRHVRPTPVVATEFEPKPAVNVLPRKRGPLPTA